MSKASREHRPSTSTRRMLSHIQSSGRKRTLKYILFFGVTAVVTIFTFLYGAMYLPMGHVMVYPAIALNIVIIAAVFKLLGLSPLDDD